MVKILSNYELTHGVELTANQRKLQSQKNDPFRDLKNQLIKEIVKKALIELAVALLFAGVTCFFVATPAGMAVLLTTAVAVVALNIILRSLNALCRYKAFQIHNSYTPQDQARKALFQRMGNFLQYLAPSSFSAIVDSNTREVVMHEAGHALAAHSLIKNPHTKITVFPLEGGQTSYRLGALSKIGEFFGRANTKLIIAAAGPAFSVLTATAGLTASLLLRNSKPELSRYLTTISINSIVQHVFYALSALWTSVSQKGHDFVQLMLGGIHPIAAAVSIVALPLLVKVGFFVYDKIKEKAAQKETIQKQFEHFKIQMHHSRPVNLAA